jgi:hypothetical protein
MPGLNLVTRKSTESSVTIPADQLFGKSIPNFDDGFCACGWPDYMLLPVLHHFLVNTINYL